MGWASWVGWIVFFVVPILLWAIGVAFVRSHGWDRALAFIVAGDNRLSLSRLQAFAWTLVIFGSFCAAMAVHAKIVAKPQDEVDKAKSELAENTRSLATLEEERRTKEQALADAKEAEDKAAALLTKAEAFSTSLDHDRAASEAARKKAHDELVTAKAKLDSEVKARESAQQIFDKADQRFKKTRDKIIALRKESFEWVVIPGALLALAGIAIGSGIFSSLISAVNADTRAPEVTAIEPLPANPAGAPAVPAPQNPLVDAALDERTAADQVLNEKTAVAQTLAEAAVEHRATADAAVAAQAANAHDLEEQAAQSERNAQAAEEERANAANVAAQKAAALRTITLAQAAPVAPAVPTGPMLRPGHQAFVIHGKDLGKSGAVRLMSGWGVGQAGEFSPEISWKEDEIVIQVSSADYKTLVVDTPNGKVCHALEGSFPNFWLGSYKSYYELADLFRDDKDPTKYDLMKFQMFGWTVIAVVIYVYLFLRDLNPDIYSLPIVPESIVLLTGLSQAGYLGSKAVSNMEAKKDEKKSPA